MTIQFLNLFMDWFHKLKFRLFGWLIFGTSRKVRQLNKSLKSAERKIKHSKRQHQRELTNSINKAENERKISRRKHHQELLDKTQEINRLNEEISDLKGQNLLWRERHDELKKQRRTDMSEWKESWVNPLEEEIFNLKEEIAALRHRASQLMVLEIEEESQAPNNVVEALSRADLECQSLFFYTDAYKAAKDCIYEDFERVLNTLRTVDQCAEIWFNEIEGTGSFEDVLRAKSLDIAPSESKSAIQRHPRIFYHRLEGDSRSKQMLNHIKLGVSRNPERTMRIHYSANRANQIIEIGYCGEHLPL